ncbi:unnamed protein product [Cyprideis torosa]|uniref:Protein MAK10 homolog n=1 Tax=Cyprideis torosa TaxID=163714 RepID=A0A7R8WP02_9CRUS|nr:unnamed protein product [Cyprideis torosa]CAG0906818.1 unnamed protein product [Cyprideis torosa]
MDCLTHRLEHSGGELGSDQLRYERRFALFSVFSTPPVVRYGQFIAMTTVPPHITAQALYTDASNQFSATKKLIEGLLSPSAASQQTFPSVSRREEELNTLLKVAKTNSVVAKLLAGGYKKGVPPSFDFDAHQFFPIMRL